MICWDGIISKKILLEEPVAPTAIRTGLGPTRRVLWFTRLKLSVFVLSPLTNNVQAAGDSWLPGVANGKGRATLDPRSLGLNRDGVAVCPSRESSLQEAKEAATLLRPGRHQHWHLIFVCEFNLPKDRQHIEALEWMWRLRALLHSPCKGPASRAHRRSASERFSWWSLLPRCTGPAGGRTRAARSAPGPCAGSSPARSPLSCYLQYL